MARIGVYTMSMQAEMNVKRRASKIEKLKAAYHIGGVKLVLLKCIGKITHSSGGNKFFYEISKTASEEDYPRLIEWTYSIRTGLKMDLNHPVTFNEKIQWLKLYDSTPLKTRLADKYLVRDYVKEKVGEQYLIPLFGVWDKFDDIDFDSLPNKFVLKANHGSGWNIIVKDKSKLNIRDAKKKFDKWMNTNFAFVNGFELHYKDVEPKIIAEEYMETLDEGDIEDYKFFCFNGEPKIIEVDFNRFTDHKRNIYNMNWEYQDVSIQYPNDSTHIVEKPEHLDEMIRVSRTLSQGFKLVRIDLYYINGRVYFGEMTFTHGGGYERFEPEGLGYKMGDWISIKRADSNYESQTHNP